jgi:Na+-driven multidrug efflux pump
VQVPFAVSLVLRGALRGAGDVKAAMVLTWVTTYLLRLPMVYMFSGVNLPLPGGGIFENPFPWHWGLTGVWVGLCAEIVIRAALFWARFAQGKWARARV